MMDPRRSVFEKRLMPVHRIVAVGGGKGGVEKTTVTALSVLTDAASGARVGLLGLDIHGAAAHLMLGMNLSFPEEEGLIPISGPERIHFMSATVFSGNRPLALRDAEVSDAISEMLDVTVWPELDLLLVDLLLVDLPPGLGEAILDVIRFMPRAEAIAVATPSLPAVGVADRFLSAVGPLHRVTGVVANMVEDQSIQRSEEV